MKTFEYTITDELGIHARPAGMLVKEASEFASKIMIASPKKEVDAKRIMGVMSMGVKKGDTVKVIAGKDKDKEGKVLAVKDGKVLVEGVNMVTKHTKPSAANQQGGIVNKEAPIDASNVMLVVKGKATRVGFKMEGDKKVRVAKATGEVID